MIIPWDKLFATPQAEVTAVLHLQVDIVRSPDIVKICGTWPCSGIPDQPQAPGLRYDLNNSYSVINDAREQSVVWHMLNYFLKPKYKLLSSPNVAQVFKMPLQFLVYRASLPWAK